MELNCEENVKRIELEMVLPGWIAGDRDWDDMWEYRQKYHKERFHSEVMCYVLREDVFELIDWHKLKFWFINDICLSSAVNVQTTLTRLIDSMQNQLSTTPAIWDRHSKACEVIERVLGKCGDRYESHDSSSQQVYAQILDYMMKLMELCDDGKTFNSVLRASRNFPFNKYQSTFLKLIDSVENQLNTDKCIWQKHLCNIIENVLTNTKKLNQQTCDGLFDYLRKLIDCCEDGVTIEAAWRALSEFPEKQISSQVYQPLIQNYLLSSQLNLRMHRNWLIMLLEWRKYFDIFKENTMNLWFEYLRKVLHKCDHVELVSLAIKIVEELCLFEYLDVESEDVLKSELMGRVQSLDSECPLASDLPDEFDFDRYQVEWCARWCVHNVMDRHKRKEMGGKLPLVKLSNDRFEARNDQIKSSYLFVPVRSQYSVTTGVYFYEVTISTNGEMMFGWSTRNAEFDKLTLLMLDKSEELICQQDRDYIFVNLSNCNRGDVIGCLIDLDNRRFVFYCNGKEVMSDDDIGNHKIISTSSYYATAFLFRNQHFYINYGQAPFKYLPNYIQFLDFHKLSRKDAKKYRLAETSEFVDKYKCKYWFKHLPMDNQVDLFYRDKRQNECDELVKRVERDIAEGREVEEMKKELECDRYIQAVIEEMGKGLRGDKVDLIAKWVGKVIKGNIEDVNKAKLVQLLYPYLHLQINSTLDNTKHRNICIVLLNLIRFSEWYDYDFIKYIRNEVFTYLTRTLTETSDQWTQLFGLIALDNLKLSEEEKIIILENSQINKILSKNDSFKSNNILSYSSSLSHQLHFSMEHLLTQLHSPPPPRPNPAALNSHDRTSHLKLSLDLLSARSDWTWQSVRSTGRVTKGIYYFEAVLLTNGPMRIGWSTKRTEIERTEVGNDHFSVAFDGYSRAVWHNGEDLQIEASLEPWIAGDVVGCLIDLTSNDENKKHFSFFLNGHLLSYQAQCPIYCSPHPYHASISLSTHQQVFLNFGQVPFQHPPNEDYLTFFYYPQDVTNQKSSINMNNSTFSNAVISIESTNHMGNLSMINHIISPTVDNILKPGLTFECVTCPLCHKNIYLSRFMLDCCACLKLSMKVPNGNRSQLAITSPNQNPSSLESSSTSVIKDSNKQKLENDPVFITNNSSKRLKVDHDELVEKPTDPQPLASTSADELEDLKQKYVILNEENTRYKLQNAELENENKTIKAERYDQIMLAFNKLNK